jgi:ribosomal protein S18 acetylase RimI-like enzyme
MSIPDHVVRFWRAVDDLVGLVRPTWWGAIVTEPHFPDIWDANYARVDHRIEDVTADEIEAELVPALTAVGASTFHVVSFFPEEHRGLLAELSSRGHRVAWDLVMELDGPQAAAAPIVVEELQPDGAFWRRLEESFALFGIESALAAQQLRRLENQLSEGGKRWFGVRERGGDVVAFGALLVLEGVGYVDHIATFPGARGRGYASAITTHVAGAARSAGAEHVFLLADLGAPPIVRMYERLGFRGVGKLGSTRGPVPVS